MALHIQTLVTQGGTSSHTNAKVELENAKMKAKAMKQTAK